MFKRSKKKKNDPVISEQIPEPEANVGQDVTEIAKQTISEQAELAEKAVAESIAAAEVAEPEQAAAEVAEPEQASAEGEAQEQADEAQTKEIAEAGQGSVVSTGAIEIKADKERKKREKGSKRGKRRTLGVKKEMSSLKKGILIAASILLVFAGVGAIMYFSSGASKSVYVVSAENLLQNNMYYYGEGNSTGTVRAENVQAQYVSESLRVNEIYVKEGDRVKVGDLIMSYDTTLDTLEVDKFALEVSQKELELINLKKQLAEINSYKPSDPNAQPAEPVLKPEHPTGEVVTTYKKLEGSGTDDDPYIYVLADTGIPCDDAFLSVIFAGSDSAWVVFENRTGNRTGGRVNSAWGVHFVKNAMGDTSFDFFDASGYIEEPEYEFPDEDPGSGYTAEQIAQMRADTQKEITDTDLKVRMMKVELAQKRLELSGGNVYSKIDGEVKEVRTETEARENDLPVLFISGGGGYVVEGTVSELMLDSVKVGDSVVINSYETGMTYDGEIISVLDLPVSEDSYMYFYYGEGAAASYYPVKIFVDESASLREDEFVSVNYDTSVKDAKYLESIFILKENGNSYIYAEGEDGLLHKRRITTGGTLWGYMTQVTGGMTGEEYIAFPYGTNIREGAKVQECTLEEFYSHMYGY